MADYEGNGLAAFNDARSSGWSGSVTLADLEKLSAGNPIAHGIAAVWPDAPQTKPQSSVDWLRQYLPFSMGDWLARSEADGLQWGKEVSDPRKLAGEAISGAMSMLPARPMAPRQNPRVSIYDETLVGRGDEAIKRFVIEQNGMKGRLAITPDGIVRNSFMHPELRGQGLGRSLYEAAVDYFGERGIPLRSDIGVSGEAVRVYDSLARSGYKVEANPNVKRTPLGGLYSDPEKPVFTVGRRPPDTPIAPLGANEFDGRF